MAGFDADPTLPAGSVQLLSTGLAPSFEEVCHTKGGIP